MPYTRPGRLRRMFAKIGYPTGLMFAFYSDPTQAVYDHDIHSVVIHRGKDTRGGGSYPSTMEISMKGRRDQNLAGHNCRFFLRTEANDAIAAALGLAGTGYDIRFTGRMGATTIEDDAGRYTSTIGAASWVSQLGYSSHWTTPTAGESVRTTLTNLMDASNPLRGISVTFRGTTYPLIAATQDPVRFRDGVGKYAGDIGILLRETRDGVTEVLPLPFRIDQAEASVAGSVPLTRSQAISPTTWEQKNEYPAKRVELQYVDSTGVARTSYVEYGTGLRELESNDWSYLQLSGPYDQSQLFREAWGRVLESSPERFTVPKVTVDLLHLIGSDRQYHRDQAARLIKLEAGDPIHFSGDWPPALQGVQIAEGITETITGDRWDLELSLVPFTIALGKQTMPTVPARAWDSAGNQWDAETRSWDAA